jgi:two-component system CheB/CheR fusion protein
MLDAHQEQHQAMCEELRTTTEELQQLNTELRAVNFALRERINEVSRARDDLRNLVDVAGVAAVIVDADLRIQRYTEPLRKLVPLLPSDIGRPLLDFASCFPSPSVIVTAPRVLETLENQTSETMTAKGTKYLTRIAPYRTGENVIEGILITVIDVTSTPAQAPIRRLSHRRGRAGRVPHNGGLRT